MNSKSDIQSYPFLTKPEFYEACHHLDRQYYQATLGPKRRQWKLRICTALDTNFSFDDGYTTYLQIIRPLEKFQDPEDLTLHLNKISLGDSDIGLEDREMIEAEDADEAALRRPPDYGHVTYEIHLHPTYRVPCLWFSLHNLPMDEQAFNIDTVFRRLVPDQYKAGLRSAGVGGISAAVGVNAFAQHHPVTGVPCFFIHPCLLGEAMSNFDCSLENYLMAWIGLVGGCVGLWVPKEMAPR